MQQSPQPHVGPNTRETDWQLTGPCDPPGVTAFLERQSFLDSTSQGEVPKLSQVFELGIRS